MNGLIKDFLYINKNEEYAKFQKRIIPNVHNIIGVKTPELRKVAKKIMKLDYLNYLDNACDDYYEEVLLQGIVIGYSKLSFDEIKPYIIKYISKINNWALCDLFVGSLKITNNYLDEMYEFIQPYLKSEQTYEIRFGVVMLLNYYVKEEYCDLAFAHFDKIKLKEYYVQMSVAWAISMYYVKYKDQTIEYLLNNQLDDFTYNKALQKIIESKQINQEEKNMMRSMKRKNQ